LSGSVCSAYERGPDDLRSMYQWLDRAPLGRNEGGWFGAPAFPYRRHDKYDSQ